MFNLCCSIAVQSHIFRLPHRLRHLHSLTFSSGEIDEGGEEWFTFNFRDCLQLDILDRSYKLQQISLTWGVQNCSFMSDLSFSPPQRNDFSPAKNIHSILCGWRFKQIMSHVFGFQSKPSYLSICVNELFGGKRWHEWETANASVQRGHNYSLHSANCERFFCQLMLKGR